jgi:hypothetical protein
MKTSPHILIQLFKMPYNSKFICFEDDQTRLHATITFSNATNVNRIFFELENLNSENFKLIQIKLCKEQDSKNHSSQKKFIYRVLMINDAENSNSSVYTLKNQELGKLDLAKNNEAHFFFNIVSSAEVNTYVDNCDYNDEKPRTKDGYIIVSL